MKKPGPGRRFFAGFFAVIFCLIFIVMAIATPLATTSLNLLNGKSVEKIVKNTDLTQVVSELLEDADLETEEKAFLQDFITSTSVTTIINAFADAAINAFKGEDFEMIDEAYIRSVLDANDAEIDALLEKAYPEVKQLSKTEYSKQKAEFKDGIAEAFSDMVPDLNELLTKEYEFGTLSTLQLLIKKVATSLIVILVLLAAIIVCLKLYRGNGFTWLAAALILPTIVCFILGSADLNTIESMVELPIDSALYGLATTLISMLLAPVRTFAIAYVVVIVISIVLKTVIAKSCNRRMALAGEPCEAGAADYSYKTVDEPKEKARDPKVE